MNEMNAQGIKEWVYHESFPTTVVIQSGSMQRRMTIEDSAVGSLKAEVAGFDGFLVSHLTITSDREIPCVCQGDGGTVGLYFALAGSCIVETADLQWHITPGQHMIYFASEFIEHPQLMPENGEFQVLEINIPTEYYIRLLSGYSSLQNHFLQRVTDRQPGPLLGEMLPVTMPMKWIINTIRQNRRTGLLKRLFLEAKTLELLMLQVEQAEIRERELKPSVFMPSAQEALYEAKAILERSLDDPPTIRHLAKMIGMNEFSLKKGFKETFHETIYGFVSKAKMQQARQILLDGNKSIQEVALMAGYKNPQHFTAAFKKFYGVLPSKVK